MANTTTTEYGALSTTERGAVGNGTEEAEDRKLIFPFLPPFLRKFLAGYNVSTERDPRPHPEEHGDPSRYIRFTLAPESIRFVTYCLFWMMALLAIAVTKTLTYPMLLKGPSDGSFCPPFEKGGTNDTLTDLMP